MTNVFALDRCPDLPLAELAARIGGKAAGIATMASELGLPVPPAFTIGTAVCRVYLREGWPVGLDDEIREQMLRVEGAVGRRFGDPADPLLVSVRSGAPVSMPGMMDTILNLGLNDATERGLGTAAGGPGFASDCRARFDRAYREIVGVARVPDEPWSQLRGAIEAVFRSWNSDRARTYRRREGIPDDLGTAVTVQAMVFGNRGPDSGTGVLFTRNPATGEPLPYGDILFDAQGEDVVAGTHRTEPLRILDERMPGVARELRESAAQLERHYADLCDIEFTIEQGKLWLLQCRVGKRSPQAALRIAVDMAEQPGFPLTREDAVRRVAGLLSKPPMGTAGRAEAARPLTTGLPASPGTASGATVTSPDAAVEAAEAGRAVILVRSETSPDDVHGMARAAGILTATGGLASHAAVVARGWGIPAVVSATAVEVGQGIVVIGGRTLAAGEVITIDGTTGEVFAGVLAATPQVVPEVAVLLGWARELGIPIEDAGEPAPPGSPEPVVAAAVPEVAAAPAGARPTEQGTRGSGAAPGVPEATTARTWTSTAADVLRVLLLKGYATREAAAAALLLAPDEAGARLDELVADGLAERSAGSFRLTAAGKSAGREGIAADGERWGVDRASAALDAFVPLDTRVKKTVSAWQMREAEGGQSINDHSDPAYDAGIITLLDAVHGDVLAWLAPLVEGLPRLAAYGERLGRAVAAARGGDGRYVASPRVDSYHGIWFELHEELILLAGRTRADEVAAGRA